MTESVELYICSSRRHLYQAAGLAHASAVQSHLLMVEQASDEPDATVQALSQVPGLFASCQVVAKHKNRQQFRIILQRCEDWVTRFKPQRIYVGNDRKYAFQYAMKCALKQDPGCRGVYMDDGTGSYESGIYLSFWRGLVDRTVVAWVKRFAIGFWYQRTRFFGGSRWVHDCLVQHPDLLPEPIQRSKKVGRLPAEVFRNVETLEMLQNCFLPQRPDCAAWVGCEAIVVLPLIKLKQAADLSAAQKQLIGQVRQVTQQASSVGIKYHPRQKLEYFPAAEADVLIDRDVPAEILFSLCQPRWIVGDTSSALLSAQWLQTKAQIISLCPAVEADKPLAQLLSRAGIQIRSYC